MKKLLFLAFIALAGCKATVSNDVYTIKQKDVEKTLSYLASDELEGRDPATNSGIEKAAVYLEKVLKDANIKPYFKTYRDTLSNYPNAYNIVGFIEGNDPKLKNEIVVIGAHYDHIGLIANSNIVGDNIANGANDNASGTTVVTEVAKYLAKVRNNKRSVLIVFFTAEELGLLGSKHLANKLKKQNAQIYTMLNFEMLGVPMKHEFELFLTGYSYSNMAEILNDYSGYRLIGKSESAEKYDLFRASDNYPFYEALGIPAHTVSAFDFTNFDYYHHVKDEYEIMDTKFMTEITQKMLPVVTKMINADGKPIHMNESKPKR